MIIMFFVLAIFLLGSTIFLLYRDQKLEIAAFAKEEAAEHLTAIKLAKISGPTFPILDDRDLSLQEQQNVLRIFSILKTEKGDIIPLTQTTSHLLEWAAEQIKKEIDIKPQMLEYKLTDGNEHLIFFTKEDLYIDGLLKGSIYVGKDVTIFKKVLLGFLFSTSILAFVFIFALIYFGKTITKKAMLPVAEAIIKQKRFITDASHELRTPLTVILTGSEVLKNDDENTLSQFSKKTIEDIQDEIHKMSELVENLLYLSKLDENAVSEITQENINTIISNIITKLQPVAQKKDIDLLFTSDENITFPINKNDLEQILYILIDNAIKYTLQTGNILITTSVKNKPKKILNIYIEDTGIGIKNEDLPFIFDRFFRADKARSRQEDGSGLGLAIAKEIAEKYDGSIYVKSTYGKGSIFNISIPEK